MSTVWIVVLRFPKKKLKISIGILVMVRYPLQVKIQLWSIYFRKEEVLSMCA